jgi:hypothetical protein
MINPLNEDTNKAKAPIQFVLSILNLLFILSIGALTTYFFSLSSSQAQSQALVGCPMGLSGSSGMTKAKADKP